METATKEPPKKEAPKTEIAKVTPTAGERFTAMVIKEFTGSAGELRLTPFQKRLTQNYFISIDASLKAAEEKRLAKAEKYRDNLALSWENVNMVKLAQNVVACARIGFDPALPNHINMIPYKNSHTNKYDIGFVEGYRGKELKAVKYGLNIPDDVIVEVVYSNDKFIPLKKDINHQIESYTFVPGDPFNRGEVIGGFYYFHYDSQPFKNKLVTFSRAEIEKRKPKYASAEFWGGEKDIWEDGKKTGKKEQIDGWYDQMVWKTIFRAAYSAIAIDSEKIDENFMRLSENEREFEANEKPPIPDAEANAKEMKFDEAEIIPEPTPAPEPTKTQAEIEKEVEAEINGTQEPQGREWRQPKENTGPGF